MKTRLANYREQATASRDRDGSDLSLPGGSRQPVSAWQLVAHVR
jgi:hypothetical protein